MLERAFAEAFATQGIVTGHQPPTPASMVGVHQARGQSAVDVFRGLFPESRAGPRPRTLAFDRSYRAAVDRTGVSPVPGAEEAIGQLSRVGVRVCLITGLSQPPARPGAGHARLVAARSTWRCAPEDAPRGCPWPDLMLTAMLRLGVEDVREAAYAGSTASGIQCGRRAGASVVAGVLTGGHTGDRLRTAGATI